MVKRALALNAAGVILAHNHPSGVAEPSRADRWLTDTMKSALALIDVKTLDHFVIAGREAVSFAERGWLDGPVAASPAPTKTPPKRGRPRKVKAETQSTAGG